MQVPPPCEFELNKFVIKLDAVVSSDIKIVDEVVAKMVNLIEDRRCWEDVENIAAASERTNRPLRLQLRTTHLPVFPPRLP